MIVISTIFTAPIFNKVQASLTTPQSGPDMKNMFENFLKEVYTIKHRR